MNEKIHPYTFVGMKGSLENQEKFNVDKLFLVMAELYGVTMDDLKSESRVMLFVELRRISMYYLHRKLGMTSGSVGKMFNRDHATVLHHCRMIDDLYEYDAKFRKMFDDIHARLNDKVIQEKGYVVGDVARRVNVKDYGRR